MLLKYRYIILSKRAKLDISNVTLRKHHKDNYLFWKINKYLAHNK